MDFLHNDIFSKLLTQSQTQDQGKAPSRAAKSRKCTCQWDQDIGNKDTTFTDMSPSIPTDYSAVAT